MGDVDHLRKPSWRGCCREYDVMVKLFRGHHNSFRSSAELFALRYTHPRREKQSPNL